MAQRTYKVDELARAAGTSVRTIRYYVQRGLLPPPEFRGKDTAYGHEHLVRLRAIRRLQQAYLPLDEIAAGLAGKTPEEIERLADGRGAPPARAGAAGPAAARGSGPAAPSPSARDDRPLHWRTWHRVEIAPGIELSVADDAPVHSQKLFERVVAALEAHAKPEGGD